MVLAKKGNIFVLTEEGIKYSMLKGSEGVKRDITNGIRAVGKPLKGYEDCVHERWLNNGWITEVTKI